MKHWQIQHCARSLSGQLRDSPEEIQSIHDSEKPREADGSMGPPLAVSAKRPVRRKDRRLVVMVLDRLPRFMEPVEPREEFILIPLRAQFDSPQLPLP